MDTNQTHSLAEHSLAEHSLAEHSIAEHLPDIICGPIVRRLTSNDLVIWLVTSRPCKLTLNASISNAGEHFEQQLESDNNPLCQSIQIGEHAFVRLLHMEFHQPIKQFCEIDYDILLGSESTPLHERLEHLLYEGESCPKIVFKDHIDSLLHGSCRKPHYPAKDAFVRVDELIASHNDDYNRPALMMLAGDQIYADDVAGPLLVAIHQIIPLLGLFPEKLEGALVKDSQELMAHPYNYYQRVELLPDEDANEKVEKRFFKGKRKPIFTSVHAQNHLITSAEVFAMYLLTWSPVLWKYVDMDKHDVPEKFIKNYEQEKGHIEAFRDDLPHTQRVFAHLPTYMIFDDHDVTDDWNLTRGWEEAAYGNPYSRRIIGNALLGYLVFQGLGNDPKQFAPLFNDHLHWFTEQGLQGHDELITTLLSWNRWHFELETTPKLIVLDTRTHRWRSEDSMSKPSGLMDWESLNHLQQELLNQPKAIIVSAAPIFGVKVIEVIQSIFTFFGKALVVDAENWMAHKGTASVILNIFQHKQSPKDIIVLSGDVHYSFVYDVRLRFKLGGTRIQQITCSGIKNCFPDTLLRTMDKLNRWFFGRMSVLNWFTRRRKMSVRARRPNNNKHQTLVNKNAIGLIQLTPDTPKAKVKLLCQDGHDVDFT